MSATLFWKPVSKESTSLPDRLKHVLLRSERCRCLSTAILLRRGHEDYFQGLRDAGVEGASEILQAIETHGTIEIWLES